MDPYLEKHKQDPLDRKRNSTDIFFIVIGVAILFIWIYAILNPTEKPELKIHVYQDVTLTDVTLWLENNIFTIILLNHQTSGKYYSLGWSSILSTLIAGVTLALLRWQPRFCSIVAGVLWGITVIFWIIFNLVLIISIVIIKLLSRSEGTNYSESVNEHSQNDIIATIKNLIMILSWVLFITNSLIFAYLLVILVSIVATGIQKISSFMQLSTRPLFSIYHTFTLAIIMMVLKSLVIVFTIWILGPKQYEPLPVNMRLFGCVFMLRLITNFTLMVISNSVMAWHWAKDKLDVTPKVIFKSMKIVLRFHLGSLVLGSTSVIPLVIGLFVACSGPRPLLRTYNFKHYCTELISKVFILLALEKFSLPIVAAQGKGFVRSMEKAQYLVIKKSSYFLAVLKCYESIMKIFPTFMLIRGIIMRDSYGVIGVMITTALMEVTYAANVATVFYQLEFDEEINRV